MSLGSLDGTSGVQGSKLHATDFKGNALLLVRIPSYPQYLPGHLDEHWPDAVPVDVSFIFSGFNTTQPTRTKTREL